MKFDVFISFRGIDTRRTFVSHLLLSLFRKRISTFKHEKEIPGNQPPSSQVLQAIEESKIAIAVISKNYAASTWCLDELAEIIDCKEKGSLVVVPVFYEVDPSDVIRQVDDLGDHGDGDNKLEKVKRWRDALAKSIQIYRHDYSYWEYKDSYSYILDRVMIYVTQCLSATTLMEVEVLWESDEVEVLWESDEVEVLLESGADISEAVASGESDEERIAHALVRRQLSVRLAAHVEDIYVTGNDLSRFVLSNDSNSFVGMNRLMNAVKALLDLESKDGILEIGIWGVIGVGKTTLVKCVYEEISPEFQDHHYFIKDTTKCSIGTCLLEDIARASLMTESESLDEVVKAKLGHRKVLLIVDDLYSSEHLENIRKSARWFGPGSRLIFVTKHKNLLPQCGVERLYEVESLRFDEALQLFSQFSFKREHVPRDYHRLSVRAVLITGRIPLALKVFGSFLRGKTINQWERELCRLEASQDIYITKLSTDIVNHFS